MLLPIVLFPLEVIADAATQTDWSGGPGVWPPMQYFGDRFDNETCISFDTSLTLNISQHQVDADFDRAVSVYAEDIDGDGDIDILGAAWYESGITWWENSDGIGINWIEHKVAGSSDGANTVFSEDINGDGDMDILASANYTSSVTWWENIDGIGSTWIEHIVDGAIGGAISARAYDLDDDNDKDILCSASAEDKIFWWENENGLGTSWSEHLVDGSINNVRSVCSGDFDGDGDLDVLGSSRSTSGADHIAWWENIDGTGTVWVKHVVDNSIEDAGPVRSADIDGDGDEDVLSTLADYHGEIIWWENDNGSGTIWIEHIVDDFQNVADVHPEDVDGDGDIDVLATAKGTSEEEISWWENENSIGTIWTKHIVDLDFKGATSVYAADVNGDEKMDVLGAASLADQITWWDLIGYADIGVLESIVLYIGGDPDWDAISWVSSVPPATSVCFQVRASDNYNVMGAWSDTLYSPCSLIGILENYDSYLQYRVILRTTDTTITPTLDEVTFSWNPLGIEGGEEPEQFELLPMCPNPANSTSMLRFNVPKPMSVSLSVFDLTGRLIYEQIQENYSSGCYSITLTDLTPGIYFCRIASSDQEDIQRFVVVE